MAITIGTQLAAYEITSLLGKGGMGEVYRARDSKLKRDVAIKVLPDVFAGDPERLARFQREAEVLASLNHPNIAQIYGLEESEKTRCIVMELVEGDTLADRLKHGPLPVDEALHIARQIAEAFEAGHEKGVVHRDLKPANIKLTSEQKVKVLDFGLAKVREAEASVSSLSNSPTMMTAASTPGVILGTLAYMSPEQARGKTVDKRTDIWAFGCVTVNSWSTSSGPRTRTFITAGSTSSIRGQWRAPRAHRTRSFHRMANGLGSLQTVRSRELL